MANSMNVFKFFEGYPVLLNMARDEVIRRGLEGQESGIPKTVLYADDTVI